MKAGDDTKDKNEKEDLKKAITFLLSKDLQEYPLEKKKEFLLQKLPADTVEKAIELYPAILNNVEEKIEEYKAKNDNKSTDASLFSSFFDIGILSSVLLATLGINYLLDLNRNKKNDLFYKECERKLNEELQKNTREMKTEISNEFGSYVKKDQIGDKINEQLTAFSQTRGLNLNLSQKTVKDEIVAIKKELDAKESKINEVKIKIDQSGLMLKQDILKEIKGMIEENSKQLLVQIIENQDKLLMQGKLISSPGGTFASIEKEKVEDKGEKIIESNDNDFISILKSAIEHDVEMRKLPDVLKFQFSKILSSIKNPNISGPRIINISNSDYRRINQEILSKLFLSSGFISKDSKIYELDEKKLNVLEEVVNSLNTFNINN